MTASEVTRLFGHRVHRERTALGWSMRDLGREAGGVDAATVLRAEKGESDIWLSTAARLTAALRISLDGMVTVSPCDGCQGSPPAGFICKACGRGAR